MMIVPVPGYCLPFTVQVLDTDGRGPLMALWKHPGNDVTGLLARCEKVSTTAEKVKYSSWT